ncbi:MAG: FHA domain-containing protein [Anaerolineales bacterium]|nr:FHA domain-containing protein [Anaerolineales bacterium]
MKKILLLLGISVIFLGMVLPVQAQSGAYAALYPADSSQFPQITTLLDVFNDQGQFISGLTPVEVSVLEDGQPRTVDELVEFAVGAQIVVAINPGPSLDIRDGEGLSRYERISLALRNWAQSLPADTQDDLSLVSSTGPILANGTPAEWIGAFNGYQPDFDITRPGLQVLNFAFDTANLPPRQPGMKASILLVTPHIEEPNIQPALEAFTTRAIEEHIQVNVWFSDTETQFNHPSALALQAMAQRTGGRYLAFSGVGPLPDPELYLVTLRRVYRLVYTSQLASPGDHQLAVQVITNGMQLVSPEITFPLDIQPPNPILVSPPAQIVRRAPEDRPFDEEILLPNQQQIEMIIEFPDRHPRPLQRTALYVDGVLVDENLEEPFDVFLWDLELYTTSAQYDLSVEAEDILGLQKQSLTVPVIVTIIYPPGGALAMLVRNNRFITIGAISMAGLVLALILFSGWRRITSLRERRQARATLEDPVTQPVLISPPEPKSAPQKESRSPLIRRQAFKRNAAPAYLVSLDAEGAMTENRIPILGAELTLGTDPIQCSQVLDDTSVSPFHSRVYHSKDGQYFIADNASVAGTWVNYDPISQGGVQLKHGDRINIGQLAFRFSLKKAPKVAEMTVSSQKVV